CARDPINADSGDYYTGYGLDSW
nr:immunoglobulin heavy chain junction region [Macaca mulatta]